jgi:hypothetical protein
MGDRDDVHPSESAERRPAWRLALLWFLLAGGAVAVLAYAAAHLPRKPLALLAVAYAAVATWVLLWLAGELRLKAGRRMVAVVAGCVIVGQLGVAWESHRAFAAAVRTYWGPDPRAGMLAQMRRSGAAAEDVAVMEAAVTERRQALSARTSISAWLRHRLSQIRRFDASSAWPAVIWVLEILAGTTAGLLIGWRVAHWAGIATPPRDKSCEPPK